MSTAAASIITKPTFTLADRLKIQADCIRAKNYIVVGRLTSVVFEAQRNLSGFSQSRPSYANARQAELTQEALKPFSPAQRKLWSSITLDWLGYKNSPILAISRDQQDLLLPQGLTPLPPIPDPRWAPTHAQQNCPRSLLKGCEHCVSPRIAQKLVGCPVVGDRVRDMIKDREGKTWGVIHPVIEMCVMLSGGQGGFGRIRGAVNPADGTHLALLLDDSNPEQLQGAFAGGRFQFGG